MWGGGGKNKEKFGLESNGEALTEFFLASLKTPKVGDEFRKIGAKLSKLKKGGINFELWVETKNS